MGAEIFMKRTTTIAFSLIIALMACGGIARAQFNSVWTSTETDYSYSAVWGDYDGDGDLDQLVANGPGGGQTNRVYRNDGGGSFTLVWSSTETDLTSFADWGDYDNDGDLDQLVGNAGVANRVYRNDGGGAFTLVWSSTETDSTAHIEWGDFDNDGDLDQLVGNSGLGEVNRVYRNDGSDTFTLVWSSTETDGTASVAWGDYDKDGDLDQLVANGPSGGQANRVYRNDGGGAFTLVWSSTELEETAHATWGDYDGDGDLDQLVANTLGGGGGQANHIYRNDGSDTFTLIWSSTETLDSFSAAWGDYDSDGDLDQLIVNQAGGSGDVNQVYRNDGSDTFTLIWSSSEAEYTVDGVWGDYDNDSDLDQLIANGYNGVSNRIYQNTLNPTNSSPAAPALTAELDTYAIATTTATLQWSAGSDAETTDIDLLTYDLCIGTSSGQCDVYGGLFPWQGASPLANGFGNAGATTTYSIVLEPGTYYWRVRTVDTTFKRSAWSSEDEFSISEMFESVWSSAEIDTTYDVKWGDVDNDGDVDILTVNIGFPNRIYRNDGSNMFSLAWSDTESDNSDYADFGDYDGDGDLDILIANSGQNRVYKNNGGISFSLVWSSTESENTHDVAWCDIDADGDLDQVIANAGTANRVYKNNGDDTFTLIWTSAETENSHSIDCGDFDKDGDPDLLTAGFDGTTRVYQNNGDDTFTSVWSVGFSLGHGAAWGDYDGDADLDIIIWGGNSPSSGVAKKVYRNDGAGVFTLDWTSVENDLTFEVKWGDLDGNGDLDLFSGSPGNYYNRAYLNNGASNFNLVYTESSLNNTTSIDLADSDGDGDLDILISSAVNPTKVYINNTNPTNTTPAAPSLTAEADIFGNATNSVTLEWSAGSDAETTDADMLTYDLCISSTSGGACDVYGGLFPSTGTTPMATGFGNAGATTTHTITLATGTYYWRVRTVDTTFNRSAWSSEDDFTVATMFESVWTSTETENSGSVAWGDYDGDGDADVLAGNYSAQVNRLYRNDGGGTFTSVWSSTETDETNGVNWGDYDNDGDLDQLVTNWGQANRVYRNDGGDVFTLVWSSAETDNSDAADWGDYDNDGDLDFTIGNRNQANHIYRNDGGGTFTLAWTSTETDHTVNLDWGDYDRDGDLDLLIANGDNTVTGQTNRVYRNDGNDTFTLVWSSTETDVSNEIFWFDYDGDGDLDQVVANYALGIVEHPIRVYQNMGSDTFNLVWTSPELEWTNGLDVGDVDGDGDMDFVVCNNGEPHRVYRNDGGGSFTSIWSSSETEPSLDLRLGDYDGDGDLDIMTGNVSNQANRLYKNNSNHTNSTPVAPTLTAEADIFGNATNSVTLEWSAGSDAETTDTDLLTYDLCISSTSGGACDVYGGLFPSTGTTPIATGFGNAGATTTYAITLATGTYYWRVRTVDTTLKRSAWSSEDSFTLKETFESIWSSTETDNSLYVYWGDYDGDGDLDQLVANSPQSNRVYRNDGSDTFTLVWSSIETDQTYHLAWGDYDGDGDLDQLVGNASSQANRVYRNDGGGAFTLIWSSTETDDTHYVAWGDYDNDGDLDQLIANTAQANRVYRNNGDDTFTLVWSSTETDETYSGLWGDYDNDGDLDQIVGNYLGQANRVYRNDGSDTFTLVWSSTEMDNTHYISLGDYDADGDLDQLVGNYNGQVNRVYRNDGSDSFTLIWTSTETDGTFSIAWGDYDGDGDLDQYVNNSDSGVTGEANRVYRNDGGDIFTLIWSSSEEELTFGMDTGDYDGDGDLDQLVGTSALANRVYRNNSNHTNNVPTAPTLTAEADIFGNATNSVTLEWSAGSDAETTDADLLTYDLCISSTSGGACDVYGGLFPSTGTTPIATGFGNAGATTTHTITLDAGTYYWRVRTVDTTFKRSAWSAEDSFDIDEWFSDSGQALGTSQTHSVFAVDVDSDGDVDFIAGNYIGGGQPNKVWLNDGSGTFTDSGQSLGTDGTEGSFAADIDSDGDLDFIAGNNGSPHNVWLNDGSGTFTDSGQSLGAGMTTTSILAADFDGDGDFDFTDGNQSQANLIWINDGNGIFADSGQTLGTNATKFLNGGDIDDDGDIDIVEGNGNEPNKVWLNDSYGTFTDSGQTLGANTTIAIALADVDGDGDMDLIEASVAPSLSNRIWLNDGSGVFSDSGQSLGVYESEAICPADFDGDGDNDFVIGNYNASHPNTLWINDGAGNFTDSGLSLGQTITRTCAATDIDNDGDVDIIFGNFLGGLPNTVWINNIDHTNTTPTAPTVTAEADVFGNATSSVTLEWSAGSDAETTDTDLLTYDLCISSTSGGACDVYGGLFPSTGTTPMATGFGNAGATTTHTITLATGTYYWRVRTVDTTFKRSAWSAEDDFTVTSVFESVWASTETDNTYSVAWGDYDGDGDLDQLISNRGPAANRVYSNDGGNTFSLIWSSSESDDSQGIVWGDYDNDGDLDQLVGNDSQPNRVYRNDGSGVFTLIWSSTETDGSLSASWGDYDNDGDLDQLIGNYPSQSNRIYRNDGNDTFTLVWTSTETDSTTRVKWGDYDNDGDLDQLVVNGGGASVNRVYRNDGSDVFTLVWTSIESDNSSDGDWGDYDGDNDLDIVVANTSSGVNRIYRNDGGGSFTLIWSSVESDNSQGCHWGDYDNDGDLDLLVSNVSQPNRVYRNDGGGIFSNIWSSSESATTYRVLWGDYDVDGDLDQLVGNYSSQSNYVYRNNLDPTNITPAAPSLTAETDAFGNATNSVTLEWSAGSDAETTDTDLLTYDLCVGTTSGACDVYGGLYPWSGVAPIGTGFGNTGASTSHAIILAPGTFYWRARTVDTTFKRSSWSAEDSFALDDTAPSTIAAVYDGTGSDEDYTGSQTQLDANWSASTDSETGIAAYWYAVGTTAGATDVVGWTSAGTATGTSATGLSLTNGATYYVSVKAENGVGQYSTVTTSDGVMVVTNAPTVSISSPISGADVSGSVTVSGTVDSLLLTDWNLYYGPGASPTAWKEVASGTVNVSSGTLGSWDASELAGTYVLKLTASDSLSQTSEATTTVTANNTATVSGTIPQYKWVLLSMPVQPSPSDPISLFGNSEYHIYRWDPDAADDPWLRQFKAPTSLSAGDAFWIKSYDGDLNYSFNGAIVDTTQDYTVSLSTGWNQVGSPFNREFPWGQAQISYNGSTYDLTTAAGMGLISTTIYSYDSTATSWVQNDTTANLTAQTGYDVYTYEDVTLLLGPGAGRTGGIARLIRPVSDYKLKLSASAAQSADLDNYIGAINTAEADYDAQDAVEPRRSLDENYTSLYFDKPGWGARAGRYANDIRPQSAQPGDTETWNFTIETSEVGETVTLSWNASALPIDRFEFTLTDLATGQSINMGEQSNYTYTATGDEISEARFKIAVVKLVVEMITRSHTLSPGWNLISVPLEPEVTNALAQLGDDLPLLDVYQYFNGRFYVAEEADIQAGVGYWVHVSGDTEIDIVGMPVMDGQGVTVPLKPGWNLLGNPFEAPLDWGDNITLVCNGESISLTDAATAGIIGDRIFLFDGENYIAQAMGTNLEPWKGYFLKAAADCKIKLSP